MIGQVSRPSHFLAARWATFTVAIFALAFLSSGLAQGDPSQDGSPLADRWLRAQNHPAFGLVPRLTGDVAEVRFTIGLEGAETEERTWSFNARGWPTSTYAVIRSEAGSNEFTTSWSYDAAGRLGHIEIGGRVTSIWFFSWGQDTVEVNSGDVRWEYTYDAENDVLTQLEVGPQYEQQRVFEFREDGSYDFTYYGRNEQGEWQAGSTGSVSAEGLSQLITTPVVTMTSSVTARDEAGNPAEGERQSRGFNDGTSALFWVVQYR